jgi:hypothetical protein
MGKTPTTKRFTDDQIELIRRDPPAILDVPTLACFLSQSERKTREDIRLRRIPHVKLGGKIIVRLVDLKRALDALVVREV